MGAGLLAREQPVQSLRSGSGLGRLKRVWLGWTKGSQWWGGGTKKVGGLKRTLCLEPRRPLEDSGLYSA